jgi:hypothetical protein
VLVLVLVLVLFPLLIVLDEEALVFHTWFLDRGCRFGVGAQGCSLQVPCLSIMIGPYSQGSGTETIARSGSMVHVQPDRYQVS